MQVQGITPGARVALLINNAVASMPFDFACAKAGVNRVLLHYPIQGGS